MVEVREVWESNFNSEMRKLQESLKQCPFISIDTEFPGTVYSHPNKPMNPSMDPLEFYTLMKRNVDALCLIQLGITLCDSNCNIRHVWQINFADFDLESQPHNPDSISLLRRQGIDFSKNRCHGITARRFASVFKRCGLHRRRGLTWITFHGAYDFGFLIKILANRPLPDHIGGFMTLMRHYLGPSVYDLKPIAASLDLRGGLDRIAGTMMVDRAAGKSHQAGSDSLLTMQVLIQLIENLGGCNYLVPFNYYLFGLTIPPPPLLRVVISSH